jgi:hypothetical protein
LAADTKLTETEQLAKGASELGHLGFGVKSPAFVPATAMLFEVGYAFGWRVSELLNLRVNQVDADRLPFQ